MCKSLVEFGFNVVLLVADGIGDEIVDHIQIFDIGSFPSRKHRLINGSRLVYKKLRELSHIFFTFMIQNFANSNIPTK